MELNPQGCSDIGMRRILDSLFLSLADAQPFGRTNIAENYAWDPRAATQSQISLYDTLREECVSDILLNGLHQMTSAFLEREASLLGGSRAKAFKDPEDLVASCAALSAHRFPFHYGKFLTCRRRTRESLLARHSEMVDPIKIAVTKLSVLTQTLFVVSELDKIATDWQGTNNRSLLKIPPPAVKTHTPSIPGGSRKRKWVDRGARNKGTGKQFKKFKGDNPAPSKAKEGPPQAQQDSSQSHQQNPKGNQQRSQTNQSRRGGNPNKGGYRGGGRGGKGNNPR
jgi:hypothetical protein